MHAIAYIQAVAFVAVAEVEEGGGHLACQVEVDVPSFAGGVPGFVRAAQYTECLRDIQGAQAGVGMGHLDGAFCRLA
ncbi:hypothetical protein D3C80_1927070 [compost metagenome]